MPFKHFQTYILIPESVALGYQLPPNISKFITDMRLAFLKLIQVSPIDPAQQPGILLEDIFQYLGIYTPSNAKPRWALYNRSGYTGPLKPHPFFILSLATYALEPFYIDTLLQAPPPPPHVEPNIFYLNL